VAGAVDDRPYRILRRERRAVRTLARHGLIRVSDGEDPRSERDVLTGRAVRIALTSEYLFEV
jgi:hypothetical protein